MHCLIISLFDNTSFKGREGGDRIVSFVSDLIACAVVELYLIFQKHFHCDFVPCLFLYFKISSKNNWKHECVADNSVFLILSVKRYFTFKFASIQ